MGRAPCCSKVGLHRGPWTAREDTLLTSYIQTHGEGQWRSLPKNAGLLRCGKSCRLRWMNYLRPDIKRGNITPDEDDLIVRLHSLLGNRWSLIARRLPGRTDNEIKNYWNTHLSKKLRSQGTDPKTHKKLSDPGQEPKKRKNVRSNGKSNREKKNRANMDAERPKIHLPKPIRVTRFAISRNHGFDCNTVSGSQSLGGEGGFDTEVVGVPWSISKDADHDNGIGFLVGSEENDLVNGSDFECQSDIHTADNTLEKLYEEYLQLLNIEEDQVQLDSFAESLFV